MSSFVMPLCVVLRTNSVFLISVHIERFIRDLHNIIYTKMPNKTNQQKTAPNTLVFIAPFKGTEAHLWKSYLWLHLVV